MINSLISFVGAICTVLVLTPLVGRIALSRGLVDLPGVRKVHRRPTARVGGIAIFLSLVLGVVLAAVVAKLRGVQQPSHPELYAFAAGAALVFLVGLADDLKDISSKLKLIILLGATTACWYAGIRIEVIDLFGWTIRLGGLSYPVTLLWIVGITVGVNFIDGLDGLAAGICAVASAAIAIVAASNGNPVLAIAAFALLGSLLGFLLFNFNPASIFMGDCGSLFLGFFLATAAVAAGPRGGAVHLILPAAVLGVPIVDTLLTMVRRGVLQRRSLFSAERGHLHHRLLDMGLKHRDVVLALYAVTLFSGLMGLVVHYSSHAVTQAIVGGLLVTMLLKVFGRAGSMKLSETIAALRRNRSLGQAASSDRRSFEDMQLRLKAAIGFGAWWREVCSAANSLNFACVELPLVGRDGSRRKLTWVREGEDAAAFGTGLSGPASAPEGVASNGSNSGTLNGQHNGNGLSNGSGHTNGNGHVIRGAFEEAISSHDEGLQPDTDHLDDVLCGDVPIRHRRAGQPLRASVAVRCDGSLESAGRRLALFVRLLEEHSAADIVEKPSGPMPTELPLESEHNSARALAMQDPADQAEIPSALPTKLRVAVVHDFLYCYGGAERVLEQILKVLPNADVFSLFDFLPDQQRGFLAGRTVKTSFIQKLPWASKKHRSYLPLMPLAIEQLDVSQYDVLVSSSYVAAKGVITRPDQLHVCYCHTPIRFAWDLQHQYLAQSGLTGGGIKSMLARMVLHYIRNWDARSSNGVDAYITNSNFVGRRIQKFYRRKSMTIYPPVAVDKFSMHGEKQEFYLTASRLVPYKRVDLIVEAFSQMPNRRLIVVGEGPDLDKIKAKAGANVKIVGHQSFERLRRYMQMASAFVFAAEEDFGIVPVEAQACGTPVIAYGRGGVTESVIDGVTGIFFEEQTVESIVGAIERFEAEKKAGRWDAAAIRKHAEQFSAERFREQFSTLLMHEWSAFRDNRISRVAGVVGVRKRNAKRMARRARRFARPVAELGVAPVLNQDIQIPADAPSQAATVA